MNYNPLMDNEAMRRQLEDLEEASERWRAERRRLNAEIDRLEAALADAKTASTRKRVGTDADHRQAIDPAALTKLQEAAGEQLKKAAGEWEGERTKLKSQINRLEGAVADAIARASNPMRATQSVKEQFEVELSRVAKEKTELEQAFLRAKTEWEQEKLKLTGEMVKLRRAAQFMGRPVPKEFLEEVNPKVLDLENQMKESLANWNTEREQLVMKVQKLDEAGRQWDTERRQLNDHAAQLQQGFMQSQAKIQSYEVAARSPNPSEAKLDELRRDKEALQRQALDAQNAWDAERRRLNSQVERLEQQLQRMSETRERVSSEVVDQLRRQYEQRLQEAIQQKTQLAQELQNASALLEAERTRLSAAQADNQSGLDTEAIKAEIGRVEAHINEIVALFDDPNTDLSTVIRKNVEKSELDAYLKGMLFSLGKAPNAG